ncbi:glycosyltransferase family 39 protein [Microbacterium sp.]|uniref:glycosyltransferase family 39 protein n=1 Tax=Microbacterium sp. TaxID=51671 RepID=UPI003F6F192F
MLELDLAPTTTTSCTRRSGWPIAIVGVLGAIAGAIGSWVPSYWGDEAASVMSASRSWPSLIAMLGTIDGVHGVYYAFLHVWMGVFGTSEFATRLPSALAAGLLVAGTVALSRRFVGTRIAVLAGAVCIVLPRTFSMADEARSYALGAAAAVWLTVLLLRLVQTRPRRLAWLGYAVGMAASIYLFLYLALLLVVHGVFVLGFHRDRLRTWMAPAAAAAAMSAPILFVGYSQRDQIAFLARRNYATWPNVLVKQWFGGIVPAALAWLVISIAAVWLVRSWRSRNPGEDRRRRLTVLGLAWLILPTSVLLLGNATLSPMYNVRYLSFCTPAAAILIALGAIALAERLAPRWKLVGAAVVVAALAFTALPIDVKLRTLWAKDGGSDWRAVAEYIAANAQPGDAIVFDQTTKPSRDPRIISDLYPSAFSQLDDVARELPYWMTARLWDQVIPNARAVFRLGHGSDVWAVELSAGNGVPADISMLALRGYRVTSSQLIHRTTVFRLEPAAD